MDRHGGGIYHPPVIAAALLLLAAVPAAAQSVDTELSPNDAQNVYQSFGAADADIPPEGIRVAVDIDVSERGRVLSCTIALSTGSARLDEAVCTMFRRTGRYTPASRAGAPVRAVVRQHLFLVGQHEPAWPEAPVATGPFPPPSASADTAPPELASAWIGHADYPLAALQARQEGDVGVRLALGDTGRVERCDIVSSSGVPSLDETTCRLALARASYRQEPSAAPQVPAPDGAAPTILRTIRWRLPPPAPWLSDLDYPPDALRARQQGTTEIAFDVNLEGRIDNCRIIGTSGSASLDDASCRLVTARARFSPAQDAEGRPVRSSQNRRIVWQIPAGL